MTLKRKAKVVFVELQLTFPNIANLLVCPCYGIVLLATMLRDLGYSVSVMVEGITKFSVEDLDKFDVICFSVKSGSANKTYQLADQLRSKGKKVIFGGTHATYFPEDCLDHCDYAVRGEGETVLSTLLDCLENNGDLSSIRGLSYHNNGKINHNENIARLTDLSIPADYSLVRDLSLWNPLKNLLHRRRLVLPVQSSRGCPSNCSFCIVSKLFGAGYRKRPIDAVISEIKAALKYTRNIQFIDNDFIGSSASDIEHTSSLLRAIIDNNLKFNAYVFAKIDVAKNKALLGLMRQAGVKTLIIGLESINSKTLACFNKRQELKEMIDAIDTIKGYGFGISATFMAGSDEDDYESIVHTAQLATEWNLDQLHYFMLTVYPDMDDVIPLRRIFVDDWDSFHGYYATFFPKNISPSKLHEAVYKANRSFYTLKKILKSLLAFRFNDAVGMFAIRLMYLSIEQHVTNRYIPFLHKLEEGLYSDGKLDEELLRNRKLKKIKYWSESYAKNPIGIKSDSVG